MMSSKAIRLVSHTVVAAVLAVGLPALVAVGCSSAPTGGGTQTVGGNTAPGTPGAPNNGGGGGGTPTAGGTPAGMTTTAPASTNPGTTTTAPTATTMPTAGTTPDTMPTTAPTPSTMPTAAGTPSSGQPGVAPTTPCPTDSTITSNGSAPAVFITECSSCHGETGTGRLYYPPIRGAGYTFQQVQAAVRTGVISTKTTITTAQGKTIQAQMPVFLQTRVSDAELMAIYNYVSSQPTPPDPNAPAPQYCLSRPEASWTQAQIQSAYQAGLKAWRTPGTVDGNACAFCHGADPMDLASIGYTDSQMYRRGFFHSPQAILDQVIDMVHAMRAQYNITAPPNPITFRPFQPGGDVLPGASALERDQAFGQELKDMGLTIMGPPINTVSDAQKAWTELAGINLRQLKVGIPLNKYTEDIFNNVGVTPTCTDLHVCDDHGTIADWITDAPQLNAGNSAAFFAAQDTYLAAPTLENLAAVLRAGPRNYTLWYNNKFLAVQIANYLFRQQAAGMPLLDKLPNLAPYQVPFPVDQGGYLLNAIWMVGANQRDFIHNDGPAFTVGAGKFNVPADTIPGLAVNNATMQLTRMIVPWFWLGFSFDQSTLNVEPDYVAEGDEYFTQETFLDNGSYPIHGAFIVSKRTISIMAYGQNPLPRSPNVFPFSHPDLGRFPVTPLVMRSGYFPEVTNFAEQKNFNVVNNYQIMYMPTNATHKALYETYAANMWRMFLWSLVGELQTTPQIWNPTIMKGKIAKAQIFLNQPDVVAANGPQDQALISQVNALIGKATVVAGN